MAKKNSLEVRRAQVQARVKAAGRKVQRLESKGVRIAGTSVDPRRDSAKIGRYTARQLAVYEKRLNTFIDRKTQYVPDVHGNPIAAPKWRRYKRTESKIKRIVNAEFNKIKDIPMPTPLPDGTTQTIADHMEATTAKFKTAGRSANSPFRPAERSSQNMANEKKLEELTKKLEAKLTVKDGKNFLQRDLAVDREVVAEMSKTLNRLDIQARVEKLSDAQFNVLFNFWGFADSISLPYELAKEEFQDQGENGKRGWHDDKLKENLQWAEKLLGDAENLKLGS